MENKDLIEKNISNYMNLAYKEAIKAFKNNEVPIGCVIVDKFGNILSKSYNKVEKSKNATFHAELLAIQKATKKINDKYLNDTSIFITLEPCPMCAMAISLAKIKNVIIGTEDKKGGAILNGIKLYDTTANIYKPKVFSGIMQKECSEILKIFFKNIRNVKK